jgi:hypothetical protein
VKWFNIPFLDPSVTTFIRNVFWRVINDREKTKTFRNDLIDLIIQLRKDEKLNEEVKFGRLIV